MLPKEFVFTIHRWSPDHQRVTVTQTFKTKGVNKELAIKRMKKFAAIRKRYYTATLATYSGITRRRLSWEKIK